MPQSDLLKELESLRKRIETLESRASDKNSLQMFGRSYSQAGSSNSDFVIKTKGQVKIQWGNKFIDLVKDGKINADMKFIFQRDSVGVKDGIYIIGDGDNQQVILSVNGNQINLKGEIGTTYVSFQSEQETTSEQKYTALQNIGFIYKNLSEVTSNSLQNGIIYVEQEQKLYIVQNGALSEFTVEFPNPYTRQFVIQKSDSSTGALLVVGTGIENSIAFDSFYLYSQDNGVYFDSNGEMYFRISEQEKLRITSDTAIFSIDVTSRMFKSPSATESSGFRLYMQDGESTLEIDNLIVRNQEQNGNPAMIYPIYWDYKNNIIISVEETENPDDPNQIGFELTLAFENEFEVGQTLYVYAPIYDETTGTYNKILLPLKVEMLNTEGDENTVYTSIIEDQIDQSVLQSLDKSVVFQAVAGQTVFLIQVNNEPITLLRKKGINLDLVEVEQLQEASDDSKVISRSGDLTGLNLSIIESDAEVPIEGIGTYSKQGFFQNAAYTSLYDLPEEDDSSRFASTEWVNDKLATIDIDLTVYSKEVDPSQYFLQSSIQELYSNQEDGTTQTYSCKYGIITIEKNSSGVSNFSAVVRATWKKTWTHRSINASYEGNQCISSSTYIIKEQFNPGYYYSREQSQNVPESPVYIGTDQQGFQVNSTNRYLWYTNDGETWILVQEYVDPIQDVLYIRTTTRNFYAVEDVQYPAGFICYNDGSTNVAIGNGRGVSNYLEVLNEYVERKPLTILQNIESIAVKGQIPVMDGYNWLWSLKSGSDPTKYDSWTLVSGIGSSVPVVYDLDRLSFGNCGGITSGVVWTKVDESGINTGSIDSSELTNGDGTESDWNNSAFVRSFLVTAFSGFLRNNMARYTNTLGWSFNYDSIVHLKGWGGYINFYIGAPENPTSDDINNIDSLPKSVFLWVNGSVFCNGHKADFYFDSVSPGLKINVGQCYQENKDVGKTANAITFFDMTYKGLRVQVTDLPQIN